MTTRRSTDPVDDRDAAGVERRALAGRDGVRVREEDHVVGPLAQEVRVLDGPGAGAEHADRLVADLPAVAVGAVQEIAAPALAGAGDVGQVVRGAGREQHLSRLDGPAAGEPEREAGRRVDHAVLDDLDAVAPDLGARGLEQVGRGRPVARQEPLHVRGGSVARRAGVDDDDPAPRPAEHERGAQAGGPASDDRHVIGLGCPCAPACTPAARIARFVAVSGNRR